MGIIDQLFNILNELPVEFVFRFLFDPLVIMIRTSVATTRIETLRNKIMSWTKSLLNNKNENAIWNATYSMFVITLTMSGFD